MIQSVLEGELAIDFAFIKSSQGTSFVDPNAVENAKQMMANGVEQIGFYHYCTPDKGTMAVDEANHFLNTVVSICREAGIMNPVALAVDFEGAATLQERYYTWLQMFITNLTLKSKTNPILYCSQSIVPRAGLYLNVDKVGLWVARWNDKPGDVKGAPWKVTAFHQYKATSIDMDCFMGDEEQLKLYFQYFVNAMECDCDCNCCKAGKCEE